MFSVFAIILGFSLRLFCLFLFLPFVVVGFVYFVLSSTLFLSLFVFLSFILVMLCGFQVLSPWLEVEPVIIRALILATRLLEKYWFQGILIAVNLHRIFHLSTKT